MDILSPSIRCKRELNGAYVKMKEKYIIAVMFVVLVMLVGRLCTDHSPNKDVKAREYINLITNRKELQVFVTLENEIAYDQTKSAGMEESKSPDYVNLYPNLYASPKTEWEEIPKDQKVCFLTFDDGPSKNTLKVLEVLKEQQIKATFFVVGEEIESEENKEILKEVAKQGHLIALHTYSHDYDKIYSCVDAFLSDYDKVFNLVEEVTGQRLYMFRFPGGSYNPYVKRIRREIIDEMKRRGFVYYDWNVSGNDSVGSPSPYSIKKNINKDLTRYQLPVVLLHDGKPNKLTAQSLSGIIDSIRKKGYSFGVLDERFPCQFRY